MGRYKENFIIGIRGNSLESFDYYQISDRPQKIAIPCNKVRQIKSPLKRIVSFSTTHLSMLDLLNEADALVGFGGAQLIYNKSQRERLKTKGENHLHDIGSLPNVEKIMQLKPDLVLAYLIADSKLEGWDKMERLNIPLIYLQEFKEKSPLARSEWIKLLGVLFNKYELANEIFNKVEASYLRLKKKVLKTKTRPVVIMGNIEGSVWVAPGGESDLTQLIRDAGGKYVWGGYKQRSPLSLGLEKVLVSGKNADYWLVQNSWNKKNDILNEHQRFSHFKPVKMNHVYNINKQVNKNGGNDYWETAMVRPDLLLQDLVKILHPKLLPNHKMLWYQNILKN